MHKSCSLKLFPIFLIEIFETSTVRRAYFIYSSEEGHRSTMTNQLCTRVQYSHTLHCTWHSREGHSVPIKKVQNLKKIKKEKQSLHFSFFIIVRVSPCYERCPTVQEHKFRPKKNQRQTFQKIVKSNLQVTEEKRKREERNRRCDASVCKRRQDNQAIRTFSFHVLWNTLSQKILTSIPLCSFFQY